MKKLKKAERKGEICGYDLEAQIGDAAKKGILTNAESEQLLKMNEARMSVTNVDDFDPSEIIPKT